jgi:hypothetical protein
MKILTLDQARDQLGDLCDDAQQGEMVFLKRGSETFILQSASRASSTQQIDWDDPALEEELVKAVEGPHAPLGENELKDRSEAILQRLRQQSAP